MTKHMVCPVCQRLMGEFCPVELRPFLGINVCGDCRSKFSEHKMWYTMSDPIDYKKSHYLKHEVRDGRIVIKAPWLTREQLEANIAETKRKMNLRPGKQVNKK